MYWAGFKMTGNDPIGRNTVISEDNQFIQFKVNNHNENKFKFRRI